MFAVAIMQRKALVQNAAGPSRILAWHHVHAWDRFADLDQGVCGEQEHRATLLAYMLRTRRIN
jgi:hypothetical protein